MSGPAHTTLVGAGSVLHAATIPRCPSLRTFVQPTLFSPPPPPTSDVMLNPYASRPQAGQCFRRLASQYQGVHLAQCPHSATIWASRRTRNQHFVVPGVSLLFENRYFDASSALGKCHVCTFTQCHAFSLGSWPYFEGIRRVCGCVCLRLFGGKFSLKVVRSACAVQGPPLSRSVILTAGRLGASRLPQKSGGGGTCGIVLFAASVQQAR